MTYDLLISELDGMLSSLSLDSLEDLIVKLRKLLDHATRVWEKKVGERPRMKKAKWQGDY